MAEDTKTYSDQKSFTGRKLDWINAIISDPRLSDLHCRIAMALSFYLNAQSGDCYVSQPKLAKRACCTDRSVRAATSALASLGYLAVQLNAGPNNTNRYRIKVDEEVKETLTPEASFLPPRKPASASPGNYVPTPPEATFLQTPVPLTPVHRTPVQENTGTDSISIIDSRGAEIVPMIIEIDEVKSQTSFDQFWEIYPRKVAKAGAEKAYSKIIKSKQATASELLAGVTRYAQERRGQDPKYTKHAATWLNHGCWQDEQLIQHPQREPMTKSNSMIAGMIANLQERGVL